MAREGSIGITSNKISEQLEEYLDYKHSLGFTLACNTIVKWLEDGKDATSLLYTLSAFLGHVKVEDAYWYLSATPELMSLACSKYEERFGGDCHE